MTRYILPFAVWLATALPAMACTVPANAETLIHGLVRHINAERDRYDLRRLHVSRALERGAQIQACDNAAHNRLSHIGSDGSYPGDRALRVNYDYAVVTENVALGYTAPAQVVKAWRLSASHRRNILDRRTRELGVAVARGRDGRLHWVMNGGLRRAEQTACSPC